MESFEFVIENCIAMTRMLSLAYADYIFDKEMWNIYQEFIMGCIP